MFLAWIDVTFRDKAEPAPQSCEVPKTRGTCLFVVKIGFRDGH